MRFRRQLVAVAVTGLGASVLSSVIAGAATRNRSAGTDADYTPFERFEPPAASSACQGATDQPFVLPKDYDQQVIAEEGEGGSTDLWDMSTQNESGREEGRFLYRTHEVGAGAAGS